jgi:hypothetical protein
MGNLIYSGGYTLATTDQISMLTEDSSYPAINVMNLHRIGRCSRSTNAATADWLMQFDFASAITMEAVILNHVNFDMVVIKGSNTDSSASWGTPSFETSELSISSDVVVDRYKIYIPLTSFNYKYLQIHLPGDVEEVSGSSLGVWSMGNVMLITDVVELSRNMSYGYQKTTDQALKDIPLGHGGTDRIKLGDFIKALISVVFKIRRSSDEVELWTMNKLDMSKPMCLYENMNVTNKVYICLRDTSYRSKLVQNNQVLGNTIKFEELI